MAHQYILTLIHYASRNPEAVPLTKSTIKAIAEALLDIYGKESIPEEVLTDQGTQFMSACWNNLDYLA